MVRQGPLSGLKVLEFAAIGPVPFAGMLLSDLGADVLRIEKKGAPASRPSNVTSRGRRSVVLDLKRPEGVEACLRLMEAAEALIEGFRPGVMERLHLGPEAALQRNPALVYGRMTGWGQSGPYAHAAGHDLNYIAISGALHAIGTEDKPVPPLNLIGDFGGGALYLAFGLVSAILRARTTGEGQVVDCAMAEGAASLMSLFYGWNAVGEWSSQRGANRLDGGAHYYNTYRCSDGKWISVAAGEPEFYALLIDKLGIADPAFTSQRDPATWKGLKAKMAAIFEQKTQGEWTDILGGTDACFAPVLDMNEAPHHPQNVARRTFVEIEGVTQPAPAPRFSRTPGSIQWSPTVNRERGPDALADWGFAGTEIEALRRSGALL